MRSVKKGAKRKIVTINHCPLIAKLRGLAYFCGRLLILPPPHMRSVKKGAKRKIVTINHSHLIAKLRGLENVGCHISIFFLNFSILNKPKRVRPTDRGGQNKRIIESTCEQSCGGCENARGTTPCVDTHFMVGRAHFLIGVAFFFEKIHTNSGKI